MEVAIPVVLLASLVFAVINFLAYVRAGQWGSAGTQLSVWAAGVFGVFLFANTDFGVAEIPATGIAYNVANGASLVFLGMTFASSATVAHQFKKAFDRSDSAATPSLIPNPSSAEQTPRAA